MNLAAALDPVPLVATDDGKVFRVSGTRVTLDTVIGAFHRGATAEEISQDYPVDLADVYAVIAYYLRHHDEIEEYLEERATAHAELRREIEADPRQQEMRRRWQLRI